MLSLFLNAFALMLDRPKQGSRYTGYGNLLPEMMYELIGKKLVFTVKLLDHHVFET